MAAEAFDVCFNKTSSSCLVKGRGLFRFRLLDLLLPSSALGVFTFWISFRGKVFKRATSCQGQKREKYLCSALFMSECPLKAREIIDCSKLTIREVIIIMRHSINNFEVWYSPWMASNNSAGKSTIKLMAFLNLGSRIYISQYKVRNFYGSLYMALVIYTYSRCSGV